MNTGMEYEDILMRNQQLMTKVDQLQTEMVRANQHSDEQYRRIQHLLSVIGDAKILLYDFDGYYDPDTKTGDAEKLSGLIDEVDDILDRAYITTHLTEAMNKYKNTFERLVESDKEEPFFVGDNDHRDNLPTVDPPEEDIVKRLYDPKLDFTTFNVQNEAANEIQQLRRDLNKARVIAADQYVGRYSDDLTLLSEKIIMYNNFMDMHGWNPVDSNEALDTLSNLDQELGL